MGKINHNWKTQPKKCIWNSPIPLLFYRVNKQRCINFKYICLFAHYTESRPLVHWGGCMCVQVNAMQFQLIQFLVLNLGQKCLCHWHCHVSEYCKVKAAVHSVSVCSFCWCYMLIYFRQVWHSVVCSTIF